MDALQLWRLSTLAQKTVAALENHGFTASYMQDSSSALEYILARIPDRATVGIGGSKTEKTMGIASALAAKNCAVHDHNQSGLSADEAVAARYKQLTADFFVCGTNAVTVTGELMNRDAFGNRVAAMMFGPKTVFVVAGTNKIVRNLEEAELRIRTIAAPMNNKKYELPNPCVKLGECIDCNNKTKSCNITTIINRRPPLTDIHVLLINEPLGF